MHAFDCAQPTAAPLFMLSLRLQLARALGPGIGVACGGVDGDPDVLWPVESAAIMNAVPRRQREFAAGRMAAREAITQIGGRAEPIPSASDRTPVWPKGLVGSIAHNGQVCVAIAGWRDQVHALGIDIEADLAIRPALWQTICTPIELATIESLPLSEQGRRVTRLFCAKEAFYKWQYPLTRRVLDFLDVQVTLNGNGTGFFVHAAANGVAPLRYCCREGRFLTSHGMVLAWLVGPPVNTTQAAEIRDARMISKELK